MVKVKPTPILNVVSEIAKGTTHFFILDVTFEGQTRRIVANYCYAEKGDGKRDVSLSTLGMFKHMQLASIKEVNERIKVRFIEPENRKDLIEKIHVTLALASSGDAVLFCWDKEKYKGDDHGVAAFYDAIGATNMEKPEGGTMADLELSNNGFSLKEGSDFVETSLA